jgi:hypothetical protein
MDRPWLHVKVSSHPLTGREDPRGFPDFFTFGTTRVVGRQPHAPAAFTPRGNPWYLFLKSESTPGHMAPSVATEKSEM